MYLEFLKKYQEELISQKISLKEDIDFLDAKLREENRFLSMLEETNDTYFSLFTPRNTNVKNKEKANEVRLTIEDYNNRLQDINERMKFLDSRLQEVNMLINNDNSTEVGEYSSNSYIDKRVIIDKLSFIKNCIFQDQQRAIVEIDSLIDSIL